MYVLQNTQSEAEYSCYGRLTSRSNGTSSEAVSALRFRPVRARGGGGRKRPPEEVWGHFYLPDGKGDPFGDRTLTTDSLIMALRRMTARRGWPDCFYSDNGTNLRGADAELKRSIQELDNKAICDVAINNGSGWKFIPPASPHWGGAWERLIRSVKKSLSVIIKERAPKDEVLSTLMAEVENIVNSRPLTHVSVEPGHRISNSTSTEASLPNKNGV